MSEGYKEKHSFENSRGIHYSNITLKPITIQLYIYTVVKECLTEAKGNDYNGHKNTTKSGLTCQAWGSNTPHKHRFGSLEDALNNCRNPDGSGRPWCYTMVSKKRWEYCDIPMCCKYAIVNREKVIRGFAFIVFGL